MTEANRQQSAKTARTGSNEEVTSDNRSSMSPIENGTTRVTRDETEPLDDQGTSKEEAAEFLQYFAMKLSKRVMKSWHSRSDARLMK